MMFAVSDIELDEFVGISLENLFYYCTQLKDSFETIIPYKKR